MNPLYPTILRQLQALWPHPLQPERVHPCSGGCISEAVVLQCTGIRFFVKYGRREQQPMFEAEQAGLGELRRSGSIRLPEPLHCGHSDHHAWLVMEYIPFGQGQAHSPTRLGEQLAAMHRHTQALFGLDHPNFIGLTPQSNTRYDCWVDFFREQRLMPQFAMLQRRGMMNAPLQQQADRLLTGLDTLLAGHHPAPSLLHGDLWSGNFAFDRSGEPVLFDPACYYGDRETDLAMTRLFGGFPAAFYEAYERSWPLPPGAEQRVGLYKLYHILNHANLFGSSYLRQAETLISRLILSL